MARFQERFVDQKGYFYPGENIIGYVTVNLPNELEFRKLTLKFKGKSHCDWEEGITKDERKTYSNTEVYFNEKLVLLSSNEIMKLEPGEYSYPFNFKLPEDIPPSFESSDGYVHYSMKIAFDVTNPAILKSRFEEKLLPRFKVVAAPYDLGQTGCLLEPAEIVKEKYLCCLCCQSGPITIKCQINKQAFDIGEPIMFNFEIDNKATDKELRKVEAQLVQEVLYIGEESWQKRRTHQTISSLILTPQIEPGSEKSWQNVQLDIPRDTTPTFVNCKCVHVTYTFILEVDIPNSLDPGMKFPVTLVNSIQCSQPSTIVPPLLGPPGGQPVYLPPVTMQPSTMPTQPPPPYPTS